VCERPQWMRSISTTVGAREMLHKGSRAGTGTPSSFFSGTPYRSFARAARGKKRGCPISSASGSTEEYGTFRALSVNCPCPARPRAQEARRTCSLGCVDRASASSVYCAPVGIRSSASAASCSNAASAGSRRTSTSAAASSGSSSTRAAIVWRRATQASASGGDRGEGVGVDFGHGRIRSPEWRSASQSREHHGKGPGTRAARARQNAFIELQPHLPRGGSSTPMSSSRSARVQAPTDEWLLAYKRTPATPCMRRAFGCLVSWTGVCPGGQSACLTRSGIRDPPGMALAHGGRARQASRSAWHLGERYRTEFPRRRRAVTLAQQTPWGVLLCKFTDTQYRVGHALDRSMAVKLGASQTQVARSSTS
jgi:hypothetical protein